LPRVSDFNDSPNFKQVTGDFLSASRPEAAPLRLTKGCPRSRIFSQRQPGDGASRTALPNHAALQAFSASADDSRRRVGNKRQAEMKSRLLKAVPSSSLLLAGCGFDG
jgi:hypothetical protein